MRMSRRHLIWIAAVVVVAVGIITTVLANRHDTGSRGGSTPETAATLFVGAANSGSGAGAAAISCTAFATQARSVARSGTDPGISFTLGAVTTNGATATAVLIESVNVAGSTQKQQYTLTLQRGGGRWLVCGQY